MPYKRRNRRYRRRRPSRGKIYGAAGKQLWKDVKMLKNMINTEFKFFDTNVNSTASTTPLVTEIGAPAVGDGSSNFEGMQYRLKSINADINLKLPTTGAASTIIRMWWILDIDSTGAIPAFTDIFTQPIAGAPTVVHRNLSNKNRFLILKDKSVVLSTSGTQQAHINYYRKMDAKVVYNTASSSVNHNRLLFVYCSDQSGAASPIIQVFNRLRFIDN